LRDLQREQVTIVLQKQNEIAQLNRQLFEATLEFRRRDFYVQPDEDGLLPSGAKDFSKNFERRTEVLIRLQELTRRRAAAIEGLALARNNLPLFKRLQEKGQFPPAESPLFQPTPPLAPLGLLNYFAIRPLWAQERAPSFPPPAFAEGRLQRESIPVEFVPNWKALVRNEIEKIDREAKNNRETLRNDLSNLRSLVLLDPDGVHEINAEVAQREKFNLKALAWQAADNLRKLDEAEAGLKTNVKLTEEEKKKIRSDLEAYRREYSKLQKAAKEGANQLARAERLQREKMERSDLFDYYQRHGKQIISKYVR